MSAAEKPPLDRAEVVRVLATGALDWRRIADKFRSCEAVTAAKADACADVLADAAFELGLSAEFDAAVRGTGPKL